jgi:hypothetical protein
MKYPFKTNEFIEEDITVRKVVAKEEEGKLKLEYENVPAKRKTMYIDSPVKKLVCKRGSHHFVMLDNRKYIFTCSNCSLHFKAFPHLYRYEDFQLIHKETGQTI